MFDTQVFFTVKNSECHSFIKGKSNSIWVSTRTKNKKQIEAEACRKMEIGFGVEITNLECNSSYYNK